MYEKHRERNLLIPCGYFQDWRKLRALSINLCCVSPSVQACTGIEDVEVAICQLEASEWVLVDAVNKAMSATAAAPAAAQADTPPTESNSHQSDVDVVTTNRSNFRSPDPAENDL